MFNRIVLVDLSWVMYRNKYSLHNLGFMDQEGQFRPTGHAFGSIKAIMQLSSMFLKVFVVVDSKNKKRTEISNGLYKGQRRGKPGEFPIFSDLDRILSIVTSLPNVFFLKEEDMEADDIINSITASGCNPVIHSVDNDLWQTPKPFDILDSLNSTTFMDKEKYLNKKYGLVDFAYLPLWYKVIRGDTSDNIPIAVKRFNKQKLLNLSKDLNIYSTNEELFTGYVWEHFMDYIHKNKITELEQNESALKYNFELVKPIYKDPSLLLENKFNLDGNGISRALEELQITSLAPFFGV